MKSLDDNYNEKIDVTIAVTYNEKSTCKTVLSLREAISARANLLDCDYQKILPPRDNLDDIFNDESKMEAVFQEAKTQAKLFLENKEKSIDCLILSGNPAMIDTRLFGKPLPSIYGETDLARAIAEMALIQVALDMGMPVLGICGGLQILNVTLNGSIKYLDKTDLTYEGHDNYSVINFDPNSTTSKAIKAQSGQFFASHYQVLDELGGKKRINDNENYLMVVGTAATPSKNIAVVESQFGAVVIGVQDHPEVATNGYQSSELPKNISKDIDKADGKVLETNIRVFDLMIDAALTFKHKKLLNDEINNRHLPSKQTIYKAYMKKICKSSGKNKTFEVNTKNMTLNQEQDTNCLKEITHNQLENQFRKLDTLEKTTSPSYTHSKLPKIHYEGLFHRLPTKTTHGKCTDEIDSVPTLSS